MFDKRMPCANLEGLGTPLENSNLKTLRKITGDQITQINSNLKTLSKITGIGSLYPDPLLNVLVYIYTSGCT